MITLGFAGFAMVVMVGLVALFLAAGHLAKKFKTFLPCRKTFLQHVLQAILNFDHGFDCMMGLAETRILGYENGELVAQLTISKNLSLGSCMAGKDVPGYNSNGELGVGAVLALADVFTTLVLLAGDSNHRPGVSVTLTGEVFKVITVGQTITIKSRILKIGSNLGFTEMWLYNELNEPLARAKHIKYLQMGVIWDMYGFLFPVIVNLYNFKKGSKLKRTVPEDISGQSTLAAIFSSSISKKEDSPAAWYRARENQSLQNFYGFMHGGAICCLLELCILDSFGKSEVFVPLRGSEAEQEERTNLNKSDSHGREPLRYLEVSFLSPCKGSLEVCIEHHSLGEPTTAITDKSSGVAERPIGCVAGKLYSTKDTKLKRLLVEASYSY